MELFENIKQLVEKSEIKKALEELRSSDEMTATILLNRYNHFEGAYSLGTLSKQDHSIEINRIAKAILYFISDEKKVHSDSEFIYKIAKYFSTNSPEKFVDFMLICTDKLNDNEWLAMLSEAYHMLDYNVNCHEFLEKKVIEICKKARLGDSESTILRIYISSLWDIGKQDEACKILEDNIIKLDKVLERGKWKDLQASLYGSYSNKNFSTKKFCYIESLGIKTDYKDYYGMAITYQHLAFLHIEEKKFDKAFEYFKYIVDHAKKEDYRGKETSLCIGYLGLAWLYLMNGSVFNSIARIYLEYSIMEIKKNEKDILKSIKTVCTYLDKLSKLLSKSDKNIAIKIEEMEKNNFWQNIIVGQIMTLKNETPVDAILQGISKSTHKRFFSNEIIANILCFIKMDNTEVSNEDTSLCVLKEWKNDISFPLLKTWIERLESETYGIFRLLEGIARLYAIILSSKSNSTFVGNELNIYAKYISDWANENKSDELYNEAYVVGTFFKSMSPSRNKLIHAVPCANIDEEKRKLKQLTSFLMLEIKLLKSSTWSEVSKIVKIADSEVNISDKFHLLEN